MPQIGELGPGVWLASGFGGHGLNTTAMAGNLIARAIVEGDQTWREFSPFELVWAGGVAGRVSIQMWAWIKRYRDAIEQRRAKARELAHRQAREAELVKQAMLAQEAAAQAAAVAAEDAAPSVIAEEMPGPVEPEALPGADMIAAPEPAAPSQSVSGKRRRRRRRREGAPG
jgi:hypothetical protein